MAKSMYGDFKAPDDYELDRSAKNIVGDVYKVSPNRVKDTPVRGIWETIANYVAKVPEVGAKFEGDKMILKTQKYATANDGSVEKQLQEDLDVVAKGVQEKLKECGLKHSVKFHSSDCRIMGQSTWRTVAYCLSSVYEILEK